jgi:uncharacterized protein YjbI with pentapeptide repeats
MILKKILSIKSNFERLDEDRKSFFKFLSISISVITVILILWIVPFWQVYYHQNQINPELVKKLEPKDRIQYEKDLITANDKARLTLAQIIGGLVLIYGLYLTWRNIKVNEEGKLTDRFSKAVELLGSDKLDIRLGGIYALERIGKDSKKDHWTVMEVFTAFIRENSPITEDNQPITADIQAALTVIKRRKWHIYEKDNQIINLSNSNLMGANLTEGFLSKANLSGADLSEAYLIKAKLDKANLKKANLDKAKLSDANLSGANLSDALLSGAKLDKAYLEKASLWRANLSDAKLRGALLSGALLSQANLEKADLSGANLSDALLSWANFSDAKLSGANLSGTNLWAADLPGAKLRVADLSGADLSSADLSGADLTDVKNLASVKNIEKAINFPTEYLPKTSKKDAEENPSEEKNVDKNN